MIRKLLRAHLIFQFSSFGHFLKYVSIDLLCQVSDINISSSHYFNIEGLPRKKSLETKCLGVAEKELEVEITSDWVREMRDILILLGIIIVVIVIVAFKGLG